MISDCFERLVSHVLQFGRATLIVPALIALVGAGAAPAFAVNWEGHQDWFHDAAPFSKFTEGVPPPIVKATPSCEERRRKHAENRYEQVAVPGLNCIERED